MALDKEREDANTCLARYQASSTRSKIYALFSHPESSKAAYAISLFMLSIIILNTITFCLESVPVYEKSSVNDRLM